LLAWLELGTSKYHDWKKRYGKANEHNVKIPHEHWHMDIAYLNLGGTFYFLTSVLDGFSRSIVHWDISEKMEERDVEMVLQKALEKTLGAQPRIISDNGPQFVAKDFKVFLRIFGLTHVRTSPY